MPAQSYFGDTLRLEYAENPGAFLSMGSRLPECARFSLLTVGVALAPETPTLACCKLISACQRFCEWVRIGFYASDRHEPPHVHVERDEKVAKFWLRPVRLERSGGFSRREINRIQKLVEKNAEDLLRSWNEYFEGRAN